MPHTYFTQHSITSFTGATQWELGDHFLRCAVLSMSDCNGGCGSLVALMIMPHYAHSCRLPPLPPHLRP